MKISNTVVACQLFMVVLPDSHALKPQVGDGARQ
jgi:hypothetical protein